MDRPLERLLAKAIIGRYTRGIWFHDCALVKHCILVPDKDLAVSIERCFLPQIRQVMADCSVMVTSQHQPLKAYRGELPSKGRLDGL